MIINQANMADLFRGYKAAFNTGFRDAQTDWQRITTAVPSSTAEETYGWLGQYPAMREWVGDRVIRSIAAHRYTIVNKTWELTAAVPREAVEDDQYGIYTPWMQELGYRANTKQDELIFDLLKNGNQNVCFDGQYFFDTDHPVGDEVVSNYVAGAGNPWFLLDLNRPLRPLIMQTRRGMEFSMFNNARTDEHVFMRNEFIYGADGRLNAGYGFWQQAYANYDVLNDESFNAGITWMLSQKNEFGIPLGIRPSLLVVGPSNRKTAKTLLESEWIVQPAGQTYAVNVNRGAVELLVTPWLQ
jgi:phage major head subunit gpT-like protein